MVPASKWHTDQILYDDWMAYRFYLSCFGFYSISIVHLKLDEVIWNFAILIELEFYYAIFPFY